MKFTLNDSVLTIYLDGRVDTTNAEAVSAEVESIRLANPHTAFVFDADTLEYISSAGLRMVLKLRKQEPTLKLINASSEVYEIFEMTGFSEMMPVEKAYRKMSVEGCEVIGEGANGKVYRLDNETIIKVYKDPDCLPDIQRERELARKAFVLGIPTAIPYDVVRVGDTYGSVFELLNAKSFGQIIAEEPQRFDELVGLYADLLKKIHSTTIDTPMPDMKDAALKWVTYLEPHLPTDEYKKLLQLVESVPQSKSMIHGDCHLKNIMMQKDEVLLIDMDTLCVGSPVFEFSAIYLAYKGFGEIDHNVTVNFFGIPYEVANRVWDKTMELYFGTTDKAVLELNEKKAQVVAYARLMRRTLRREPDTEVGKKTIESCRKHLTELLSTLDTIVF